MNTDPVAALESVSRSYDQGRVVALQEVTLRITRGESLAIVGPSGSGKSTLLHILGGLDRPTQGRVLFEGSEPRSVRQWARLRAERIGFVFQAYHLLPTFTALENVQMPMFGVIARSQERHRRAGELLARVGLAERVHHRPSELSGGERQRVAIARSLANSPSLILADEPTGNLDSQTSAGMMELLTDLHVTADATLVIVTHDSNIAAYTGRQVSILDGRIASE
jgi:ABC-type lipoprotein export system ATPase subunit